MRLLRRLAHWIRLRSNHDDLIDELALHRELLERDLIRGGMAPDVAAVRARRTLGPETLMREEARAVWVWPSLEAVWQDATYTLRDLRRHPTFTIGVVLTLALGIGANTSMFSLVDRLLFRAPARMIDPASVHRVYLYRTSGGVERETGGQYARYADLARWTTSFSQTAGVTLRTLAVGTGEATRLQNIAVVSAGFFGFFDAPPALGRYFSASEDAPPSPAPVAVLSHTAWTTQYASRRDVIGTSVRIDAVVYTIVGVAPEGFVGLWPYQPPTAYVPVATFAATRSQEWATTYTTAFGLGVIARRKPNVSVDAASADLTNALRRSLQVQNEGRPGAPSLDVLRPRAIAASVLEDRGPAPSSLTRTATWLSGVTLIVLVIACANVANLVLARTVRRRREIAVRVALGISRRRLVGQLATEGIVLATIGAVAGIAMAVWGSDILRATLLPETERASLLTDARTLVFAGVVALGTAVAISLAPMLQAGRGSLTSDLKAGAREGTYQRTGLRGALLLVQSALSVILLVGAGLFVRSLQHARAVRLGFDADPVLLVSPSMRDVRPDSASMAALRLRLLQAAQSVPGVTHATLQESVPFEGMSSYGLFVDGVDSTRLAGRFDVQTISSDYFATMGTRILRGRAFARTDDDGAPRVTVIGESMAAALWPGQDPIGRCIRIGADTMPCTSVVGIAEDIHSQSIDAESNPFFYYLPAAQWQPQEGGLFVRVRGDAALVMEPLRRQLQREMPGPSFVTVRRLADIVDTQRRSWIVGARVFTAFGVLALVLAAVGLYSVIAYNVTQRRHEMGVRLALGAAKTGIVRLVVAESVRFALAGVAIGGAVALAAGRWIGPWLYRQSPRDPGIFVGVAAVLLLVAVAASWIPAMRAAGVDPKTALQSD